MKALIILLMLVLVTVHVWLSQKRFHGPEKLFLKDEVVQLVEGVTMQTEYLDRVLEGSVSGPDHVSAVLDSLDRMNPPGRVINRLSQNSFFHAWWSGSKLKFSGELGDAAIKQELVTAVKMPVDYQQLKVIKNATPNQWSSQLPAFMNRFTQISNEGEIRIGHQSVLLKGKVQNLQQKLSLLAIAESWQISIIDQISLPQQPATLLARLKEGRLLLKGNVPTKDIKKQLADQLISSNYKIDNQLKVSDQIVNSAWLDKSKQFLPAYFRGIKTGEIELDADYIRINREVTDQKQKDKLLALVKGQDLKIVDQLSLAKAKRPVQQPANIELILTGRTLTLSGLVSDRSVSKLVTESIRKAVPDIKIVDRLVIDEKKVKRAEWSELLGSMLLDFFADNPASAELEINHQFVRFKRDVANEGTKQKLASMARDVLPNGKYVDQLRVRGVKEKVPSQPNNPAYILATLSDSRLEIKGALASQELKKLILDSAKASLPGVKIYDQIVVAPSSTKQPAWNQSVKDLFLSFWSLRPTTGEFEIAANQLRIRQELKTEAARDLLLVEARRFASASKLRVLDQLVVKPGVKPRPSQQVANYTLRSPAVLARKPASVLVVLKKHQLTLSGNVPTDEMRLSIAETALTARPRVKMMNNIKVDKEIRLPAWDLKVLDLLSDFLSSPADSEFEVNPEKIRLKQSLPSQRIKDKWVSKAHRFMPGNNRFEDQLSISPNAPMPAFVNADYESAAAKITNTETGRREINNLDIYFLTNSTWVNPKYKKQIYNAVQSIKGRGNAQIIEVKGFADQRGSYASNKRLSEGRAEEVVKTLVTYGLNRENIQVLAVGEAKANGASERDRRVEVRFFEMR